LGSRITFIGRPYIRVQELPTIKKLLDNLQGNLMALFGTFGTGQVEPEAVVLESRDYLAGQVFQKTGGFLSQVILQIGPCQGGLGKIAREQDAPGLVDQLHH